MLLNQNFFSEKIRGAKLDEEPAEIKFMLFKNEK
jgi:hypothetical protein